MKKELVKKWLKHLQSYSYAPAKHRMWRDTQRGVKYMCCLGVLCDIEDPKGWDNSNLSPQHKFQDADSETLSPKGLRHFGITKAQQAVLTKVNDNSNGTSFDAVIAVIKHMFKVK